MIFRRITIENAGPFLGNWEVELPEGITAVVAEYEDASSRSNRAGKSFVAVDTPRYAFFGDFRGKTDDFVHRLARGREDGFVEVEVETSEGARHVIRRGRDRRGNPIRMLNGSQIGDRDLEAVVRDEILGLSAEEYLLTNAFVQGEMHSFMKMPADRKRRVVSPWFKTDRWIPRAELANSRLNKSRSRLRVVTESIETRESELGDREEIEESVSRLETARESARKRLRRAQERRAVALAELDAVVERRGQRAIARREVERLERELEVERSDAETGLKEAVEDRDRARDELETASSRESEISQLEREVAAADELKEVVEDVRAALRSAREGSVSAERARKELLERYRKLESDRTGRCPILRESCDRVEPDTAVLDEIKGEGLSRRREIKRLEKVIEKMSWKLDRAREDVDLCTFAGRELKRLKSEVTVKQAEHDHERAKRAVDDAETVLTTAKSARTETGKALIAARRKLKEVEDVVGDEIERKVAKISEDIAECEEKLDHLEKRLSDARVDLAGIERLESEIEELREELPNLRTEIENLAWAAYAFGAAGIPSRELENAFGVAEQCMNRVLEDVETPLRLRFSPTRELQDWEPACLACGTVFPKGTRKHVCGECGVRRRKRRRDELRLEVLDGEYESAFDLDSGGGKILLSVGARLGLSSIPGGSRRVRCQHLLLDEPDGALDLPNRLALYSLLRGKLPDLGIRQAILITHTDVRDQFDSVVSVHRWPGEDRSGVWND